MKDDRAYLLHIRDFITRISEYTKDGRDAFFADQKTQDAVIRNFEIIGEAVKNLSAQFTNSHSDVPWARIARFRDTLIHRYFRVELEQVWEIVQNHMPSLRTSVEKALEALPDSAMQDKDATT